MYLRGRGKIGYITGDTKQLDVNDKTYAIWDAENSMVMTWLVNSMTEEISANYLCDSTAKELWDNVTKMYSDLGNQSQVYELTLRLGEIFQGEDSVTKYFNSPKRIWQDLDLFNDYEWKSKDDCNQYKKIVDTGRIFKFLAGLNVEYDEVHGRIIGRNSLPPIGEVFAEVRREESRRHVMLGKKTTCSTTSMEGSALAIPEAQVSKRTSQNQRKTKTTCNVTMWKAMPYSRKNAGSCMVKHLMVREKNLVNIAHRRQMRLSHLHLVKSN
ncbi:hypothetical protein Pint_34347 [Pistacia integerrima]|uniref:Uncharacterized protein n=1 Tax=Pistacia integerrima TaxID=434235 RepID=A0ACC0X5T3_9ROSI|nr:hypothetical protein Pint_34347 [Pistacia integerrima]